MTDSMLYSRPIFHHAASFEAERLHERTPSASSVEDSDNDSDYLRPSDDPTSPLDIKPKPVEAVEPRTTIQGKDWRGPSHIHKKTFWERTWSEKILSSAMMDDVHHELKPGQRGPVPSIPLWVDQAWLIPRTFAVPVLQQVCLSLGWQWSRSFAFLVYFIGLSTFFMMSSIRFNQLGKKHGTFNEEERGRDRIPDESVDIMGGGILMYFSYRVGCMCYYYFDPAVAPLTNFGWTYILRWQAWFLVMDYFFYAYHRATHEVEFLWKIHSYHHKAKHPTMAHAILAGHMQHFLEIIVIPSLSTYIVPLSFHEQWVLYLCLAHIETMGHSGVRIHAANPNTWLACLPFGAELTIEDHDLHHRHGRSGKNYGKQTRFWDKIFGTMENRLESGDCTTRWI